MRPFRLLFSPIIVIQILLAVHLFAASKSNPSTGESLDQVGGVVPNVLIIKFKENPNITENGLSTQNPILDEKFKKSGIFSLNSIFSRQSMRLNKSVSSELSNIYLAHFQGEKTPWEMAELVSSWPEIVYAEPKYLHYIVEEIPNDTLYDTNQSSYYEVIQAPEAWGIVKGEQGNAIIAIVDGGTEISHSDLSDNKWQNQIEIYGITGVDDDGNGFVDDLYGWNFANQSGDPTGLPGTPVNADHGTHTAGIASAVTNNITGVAGLSWNATVMGINVSDESSDRVITYGLEGIIYAAENGADIISCSWGRLGDFSYFGQEAVNYATLLGATIFAAAGNNGSDNSHYPSSYQNVFSIAATSTNDNRYTSTNYGSDVDLAAPGVNIFSTFSDDGYGFATGTSMSAPMAAGAAGLVRIQHPTWTGLQIGEQVRVTVDPLPEEDGQLGRGRLNVYHAVTEISPSIRLQDFQLEDENGNGTIEPGENIEIYITVKNYLEPAENVNLVLISSDSHVTITQSEISVSSIGTLEQIQPAMPFVCEIAANTPEAYTIDFTIEITTNEYSDVDYLSITVLPGFLNLSINNIKMTVTSLGRIVNSDLSEAQDTVGFSYKYMGNLLYEGAIISGTSSSQISNAARAGPGEYDEDFVVTTAGEITSQIPGTLADEESFGQFVDQEAVNPMNIRISQYTYTWQDSINDDYIIIRFVIQNLNSTDLNDFHFGLFFDWDIDAETYDTNVIRYGAARKMGYAYDAGDGPDTHVGVLSLSDEEMNFEAIYTDDLDVFTYEKKWESISSGITTESLGPADVTFVIANGPISIPAYSIHRLAFAMVAANDSLSLFEHADSAIAMWENLVVLDIQSKDTPEIPNAFRLIQNYPNPFNPVTIINYELPITNFVELSIYNIIGQKVATLVSEKQSVGRQQVEWDASEFASGIYYYEIRTENFRDVKKMVLMK